MEHNEKIIELRKNNGIIGGGVITTSNNDNNYNYGNKKKFENRFETFWFNDIMENFTKANLFLICCITAGLLLIAYLAAFSCEVSWLLEAKGDLPFSAYLLCAGFFIMFVASTILIHGLVTGLSWGLFSWSIIIGILSIPELAFVMIMTTQHWGLQSTHGLTELISYLIRLIINCVALICVIPTALKWKREAQVLNQLQILAQRLQLQTPPPSVPQLNKPESIGRKGGRRSRRASTAFDNPGFLVNENFQMNNLPIQQQAMVPYYNGVYGSQNEFNASYYGGYPNNDGSYDAIQSKRAQSLLDIPTALKDLRCTLPGLYNPKYALDEIDNCIPNNLKPLKLQHLKYEQIHEKKRMLPDDVSSQISSNFGDPIYSTIVESKHQPPAKLSRNCVSLENLGGIDKVKNDLFYGNNLLQNYAWLANNGMLNNGYISYQHSQQQQQHPFYQFSPFFFYNPALAIPRPHCGGIGYGGYTNPFVNGSGTNSKQSLGQESDNLDYRKYRDVAL